MAVYIETSSFSGAWLQAMQALRDTGGEMAHLVVCIGPNPTECKAVTAALDRFLHPNPKAFSIEKVAGTIFPWEFYLPDALGAEAQNHLYQNHRLARLIEQRWNRKGNYFDRMVCWPGPDGNTVNQLEKKIVYYRGRVLDGDTACNAFEVSLAGAAGDCYQEAGAKGSELGDNDIRIYDPNLDKSIMSFPCLSHLSVSLSKRKLHMAATYRNQYFIQKAYGNYLGLYRLLAFLAHEIGVEAGELLCIATHADDERGKNKWTSKTAVSALLAECSALLEQSPSTPAETLFSRSTRESHLTAFTSSGSAVR